MGMFSGGNIAMNESTFERVLEVDRNDSATHARPDVMTAQGAITKTCILAGLLVFAASFTWRLVMSAITATASGTGQVDLGPAMPWAIGGAIGGAVLGLIIVFVPKMAAYLSPAYAIAEGLFLGAISAIFEFHYPGIVTQAVGGTVAVLIGMLALYKLRIIVVNKTFVAVVLAATMGIFLFYMFSIVLSLFGVTAMREVLWSGGPLGIGISVVIIIVAALNLVLDFDLIERGSQMQLPKYMEWYAGFGLLVTLVWLYLEFLRLFAKMQR